VLSHAELLENPRSARVDTPVELAYGEEKLLGISLTCSRVDGCDTSAVNCSCKEFLAGRTGCMVLGVEVGEDVRELRTKSGKNPGSRYARMTLADGTCAVEAVAWPETWKEYGHLFIARSTLIVQVDRDFKDPESSLMIVKKAWRAAAVQ
jgi:DNA polymerase III alpha subunit